MRQIINCKSSYFRLASISQCMEKTDLPEWCDKESEVLSADRPRFSLHIYPLPECDLGESCQLTEPRFPHL